MKIYTKKGDQGQTSLIGGTKVPKHHLRINAYGTVDELNSYIGLLRDQDISKDIIDVLLIIQERLFTIGSMLAADPEKSKMKLPEILDDDITLLETEMDQMESNLPEMRNFVLPGGHQTVSFCHLARCVCRRAERLTVELSEDNRLPKRIIIYLNRLSDYLFVLARKLTSDLGAEEIPWIPKI